MSKRNKKQCTQYSASVLLAEKLREKGYAGLYNTYTDCCCTVDDLMANQDCISCCEAAMYYQFPLVCPECNEELMREEEFHETTRKEGDHLYVLLPVSKPILECYECYHRVTGTLADSFNTQKTQKD